MTSGKVKTLFSDKEKTEALFPRTKTSAVSNEDGIGLDALMENLIYSSNENLNQDTVPLNADTLGGFPAEDYASKLYVKEQILKVQEGTGVDLSEFATKEDLASIDYPVDSVNGYTGTIQLNANDVGALGNKGNQSLSDGSLQINDTRDQGYCFSVIRTRDDIKYNSTVDMIPTSGAGLYYYKDGVLKNKLTLGENSSSLYRALTIESGGTGATTASEALFNLSERDVTSNANLCLDSGHYYTNTETLNIPYSTYGFLYVVRTKVNWIIQTWHNINDGIVYTRSSTDGGSSFSSWDTGTGTNKVFNKLTDIGIATFPTTMQTVANAMPKNSTLMLDSRDIISGGTHEISDLGLGNAGMYMFMRGNSNARLSLLHIYGATSSTTSYMNFGCYAATNNSVVWKRVDPSNFAPSGYGLGHIAYNLPEITDANTATNNGWYLLGKDATNGFGYKGAMHVNAYSPSYLMQTLYVQGYSTKIPVIVQRTCVEGNWSEWAFVNPPMIANVEYLTTKLYKGKPVYAYCVDIGALPASGATQFTFGDSETVVDTLISMEVFAHGSSDRRYKFPFINTSGVTVAVARTTGNRTVYIHVYDDVSAYTGHAFFEYTKQ